MNNIKFVKGDLFESKMQVLVNPINCIGVMGGGLALEFKKRFPDMFREYQSLCDEGRIKIGKVWLVDIEDDRSVLLFPTKGDFRKPSELWMIERGLQDFVVWCEDGHIQSVAFPALGCGLGGLSWEDVKPLMVEYLKPLDIPVEVYLPEEVEDTEGEEEFVFA